MPKGGSLTFKTELTDAGVRVTVSDTGLGMSDNVRQHIFEPLYTTKGDRGTGMGLAVSYGIIQEHEGTIRVETGLGVGSTFVLVFPPAEEASPERNFEPERKPGRSARILVVDDERMVRTILVKLLSLKGHDVEQAASGSEALSIVESQEFDVVFTDLGMPEMNGRQLARALRRKCPELPIVLLTGDTNVGEPGEDVDVVLAKPFKIDQLEATIQDLIREESQDAKHR
jgi:CheY-like chemotaxis protein